MKWGLIVALLLTLPGCAVSTRHILVVADTALYEALSDLHEEEQITLCGQASCAGVTARVSATWTDEKSQDFNRRLLPGVMAGRAFNDALASWKPGAPMPVLLHNLIRSLAASLTAIATAFPDGTTKTKILADIAKAQSIVLSAIELFTTADVGAGMAAVTGVP